MSSSDFGFDSKDEVQKYYDNFLENLKSYLVDGIIDIDELGDNISWSKDNFEEYTSNESIIGYSNWRERAKVFPLVVKSMEGCINVLLWHRRHALAEYHYFYTLIDGSTFINTGKIATIWDKNGKMIRWAYFADNKNQTQKLSAKVKEIMSSPNFIKSNPKMKQSIDYHLSQPISINKAKL